MARRMRPARLALALIVPALFLTRASGVSAQAGGSPPLVIKSFQFVHAGHIYQSGASLEVLPGSGSLELGVYNTTGQVMQNAGWQMRTANGSFDTGPKTAAIVPGPEAFSLLTQPWSMTSGTHHFIGVVRPPAKPDLPGAGLRGPTAELTLTVRVIAHNPVRTAAIPLPPAALAISTLEDPGGHCKTDPPTIGAENVQLVIRSASPTPAGFAGCALVTALFRGVQVGNGWTVLSVDLSNSASTAQPVWESGPSGTSLAARLRMPITPAHPNGYFTTVKYSLKGPAGTQPTFIVDPLKIR